jgi:type IV secretory pathway VirB3-like protein
MLAGLKTKDIGFFRTPKMAEKHTLFKALSDAREELLFGIALTLAAVAIGFHEDAYLLDTKLWMLLLCIQSIPYFSAVLVSLVSAYDKLPASLIHPASRSTLVERLPMHDTMMDTPVAPAIEQSASAAR